MKTSDSTNFKNALSLIMNELERPERIHPIWPEDIVHQGAIVAEEAGEVLKECLNNSYKVHDADCRKIKEELSHTGAMVLRMLINL